MVAKARTPKPPPTLAEFREGLGLTRAALSRLVGCSERALAGWENEGLEPSPIAQRQLVQLRRLCAAAARVMQPRFVGPWLIRPSDALDGLKPVEVIERGESDRLWRALFAAESGQPL